MSTAKERFEKLDSKRDQVLQRARDAADITIPALMPPEGTDENASLPQPYQSLGARGVNNLTSKLRLSLFPPGRSFFRFQMDRETKTMLSADAPEALTEIESGLQQVENDALELLEAENHSVILHAAIKQLVCCGNVLLHIPDDGGSRIFRLPQYVIVRDPMGNWHEIVALETVSKNTLEEAIINEVDAGSVGNTDDGDDEIDVYHWDHPQERRSNMEQGN